MSDVQILNLLLAITALVIACVALDRTYRPTNREHTSRLRTYALRMRRFDSTKMNDTISGGHNYRKGAPMSDTKYIADDDLPSPSTPEFQELSFDDKQRSSLASLRRMTAGKKAIPYVVQLRMRAEREGAAKQTLDAARIAESLGGQTAPPSEVVNKNFTSTK